MSISRITRSNFKTGSVSGIIANDRSIFIISRENGSVGFAEIKTVSLDMTHEGCTGAPLPINRLTGA